MTNKEAIELVIDLAKQNMIDEDETDSSLLEELARQREAIQIVEMLNQFVASD